MVIITVDSVVHLFFAILPFARAVRRRRPSYVGHSNGQGGCPGLICGKRINSNSLENCLDTYIFLSHVTLKIISDIHVWKDEECVLTSEMKLIYRENSDLKKCQLRKSKGKSLPINQLHALL